MARNQETPNPVSTPTSSADPTRTRDEVFRVIENFEGMLISLLSILYQPFHHQFFTGSAIMARNEETQIPAPSNLLAEPIRTSDKVDDPSLYEDSFEKAKGMLIPLSILYQPFHH